jgi:hypothetical protein
MTQEEVIKDLKEILARDIGYTTWTISTPHLVSLVNKAIEAEREACAVICDEVSKDMSIGPLEKYRASWIAQAIRARGNK